MFIFGKVIFQYEILKIIFPIYCFIHSACLSEWMLEYIWKVKWWFRLLIPRCFLISIHHFRCVEELKRLEIQCKSAPSKLESNLSQVCHVWVHGTSVILNWTWIHNLQKMRMRLGTNVWECPQMSGNVSECPRMSGNVRDPGHRTNSL